MVVRLSRNVAKQLRKVPLHIRKSLNFWILSVQEEGIDAIRRIPGYHDEPLAGEKLGRRSIRLNRQWRAEYIETEADDGEGVLIDIILILEVHPHDY